LSHIDNKRILCEISKNINNNTATKEEMNFISIALNRIGKDEDANKVFEVKPKRGQSDADAAARQKLSFIMHWIACAIQPIDAPVASGLGLTVEKACEIACIKVVPAADKVFGNPNNSTYDADYLKKCWYQHDKKHMQDTIRHFYQEDYPY